MARGATPIPMTKNEAELLRYIRMCIQNKGAQVIREDDPGEEGIILDTPSYAIKGPDIYLELNQNLFEELRRL